MKKKSRDANRRLVQLLDEGAERLRLFFDATHRAFRVSLGQQVANRLRNGSEKLKPAAKWK